MEENKLAIQVESEKAPVASVSEVIFPDPSLLGKPSAVTGFGAGLSFEQQKELLLLQLQHEQQQEKMRQNARLREAEMAHAQAKQQFELERYKLELVSQGKLQTPEAQESAVFVPLAPSFDVEVGSKI